MIGPFSRRLLTLLQFTRFALVFTAISNSMAAMLLAASDRAGPGGDVIAQVEPWAMFWMAMVSIGLYGFGMSLNDIIDRRRDQLLAADRPLPSGRLGVIVAHLVCALLLALALASSIILAQFSHNPRLVVILTSGVVVLVFFYDIAGKYLVPLGLLTLGLIRFFHASIATPGLPMPWHALLLFNHVTILSAVAYAWEQKRPALMRRHVVIVALGIVSINVAVVTMLLWRRGATWSQAANALRITPELMYVVLCAVVFAIIALVVRVKSGEGRGAGKSLMLIGLLWLIVYDVAFVALYADVRAAMLLSLLLPLAYFSVKLTRSWNRLIALSEPARYIRAR